MSKFSKSKIIGVATVSLAAVSLLGVGFSTWVLNPTTQTADANVTVTVADVIDNRITLSASASDGKVVFDCGGVVKQGHGPIKTSTDAENEDLVFKVKYTVKGTENSTFFNDSSNKVRIKMALGGSIGNILGKNGKGYTYATLSAKVSDGDAKTITGSEFSWTEDVTQFWTDREVTFTFAWGTAFNDKNPVSFDDTTGNDVVTTEGKERNVNTVIADLKALQTADSSNITVTVTAEPIPAA